jgi:hypothetical protein
MTYTVTESWEGRDHDATIEGERTYARTFNVETSAVVDPDAVRLLDGVPRLGDIYTSPKGAIDTGATCRSVRVTPKDSPKFWRVECRFSSRADSSVSGSGTPGGTGTDPAQAATQNQNPLLKPAKISWGTVRVQQVARKDARGKAILNSAGDAFDPPLMKDKINLTLKVQRNQQFFDGVKVITGEDAWEAGQHYWSVNYEFEVEGEDIWRTDVLDCGYRSKNPTPGGPPVPIKVLGLTPSGPTLLDGEGAVLASPGPDTAVFLPFVLYEEVDFAGLNL